MTDRVPAKTAAAPPSGAYGVWPADKDGNVIAYRPGAVPNPALPEAVEIYFGILQGRVPPQNQSELQAGVSEVLTVAKSLYLPEGDPPLPAFRLVYIRLFRIAQLGLEGDAAPDLAKAGLDRLTQELIDAEAGRVKNKHLMRLGAWAASLAAVFTMAYLLLGVLAPMTPMAAIGVDAHVAQSFMMVWVGCLGGVWLSYGIRTTTFKLRDLVITDADRLQPLARLIFAGMLTTGLGLALMLGWADIKLGQISIAAFVDNPTEGLLLGLFCGVSELLLPGMVSKRAADLLTKVK